MKARLAALMMALASPALADSWYFEASLEGGAEFWTFTNETGDVSPRRQRGNEIWISRTDEVNGLDENGTCDFNNCTVTVTLADRAARDADVADLPPTAAEVLSRMRDDPAGDPFRNEAERLAFREEIDARIGDERAIDLATGDDDALEEVLEDRLDRLYMAKAYLQSDAALAQSAAMEHVLDEIANEEIEVQRERHGDTDSEGGPRHG